MKRIEANYLWLVGRASGAAVIIAVSVVFILYVDVETKEGAIVAPNREHSASHCREQDHTRRRLKTRAPGHYQTVTHYSAYHFTPLCTLFVDY